EIPVAQSLFLRVGPVCVVRKTKQEAGERASVIVEVRIARVVDRGLFLAEVELTALALLFVVVLIRAANLTTDVEGVASLGPEPVVHEGDAELAVDRSRVGSGDTEGRPCVLTVERDVRH